MPDEEPVDFDDSPDETEEEAKSDGEALARSNEASESAESAELAKRADAAAKGISDTAGELQNMRLVIHVDARYVSDLDVDYADADADTGTRLRSRAADTERVHVEIGTARAKGKLYTRWKFWAIVLPFAYTVVYSLTTAIAAANAAAANQREKTDDTAPKPDLSVLPAEVTTLLEKKAKEWSTMPVAEAFAKLEALVTGYQLSLQAQAFLMGELKRLAAQPAGFQKQWQAADLDALTSTLVAAYGKGGSSSSTSRLPRSPSAPPRAASASTKPLMPATSR